MSAYIIAGNIGSDHIKMISEMYPDAEVIYQHQYSGTSPNINILYVPAHGYNGVPKEIRSKRHYVISINAPYFINKSMYDGNVIECANMCNDSDIITQCQQFCPLNTKYKGKEYLWKIDGDKY